MRLEAKVAIITGGGAGIGRACVELFAREGARVVVAEFDAASGEATRDTVVQSGGSCLFVPTDVSQPDDIARMVDSAMREYGRIDILYNNAGGSTLQDGPVTKAPHEEFWRKMKVDLFGTWLGCQHVIPHMIAGGGGSIINASSMYALTGTPNRDAYTAAKGAITALTRSMAVEFAPHRIRVNAVAAAGTRTERVQKRLEAGGISQKVADAHLLGFADPIDVAQAVLYLGSDESRATTGHILTVDSGYTIGRG
ncbi:MAG TPA: SDR family oxidoreductase [Ramlibacter sp.]|nr:SDR family oxidoreductase [Ramlibacter sp.]